MFRISGIAIVVTSGLLALVLLTREAQTQQPAVAEAPAGVNLAVVAVPSASYPVGQPAMAALQDDRNPRSSRDREGGEMVTVPPAGAWVEYTWPKPISTDRMAIYFSSDGRQVRAPSAYRYKYWDGKEFVAVPAAAEPAKELNQYNVTAFPEVTTTRVRLEFESENRGYVGILEWKVFDSGKSARFGPKVSAGTDRIVVIGGQTHLNASIRAVAGEKPAVVWSKASGPGEVKFADAGALSTTATFSDVGEYTVQLKASLTGTEASGPATAAGTAATDEFSGTDTLTVRVERPAAPTQIKPVTTTSYKLNSRLWNDRAKALIVTWIPHCYTELSNLELREGGINNFIQAANKLAGRPSTPNTGYPFTDAYVYNTIEAMCMALMVELPEDAEVKAAKRVIRGKLEDWIPLVLAAQEPDGYLQTRFTRDPRNPGHWTIKGDHEGYVSGYFLEAAMAHYRLTNGTDRRMYDAAVRLADCWERNLGPAPKKNWFDGHQEMEYALIRFAAFVDEVEGRGHGDKYVALSKFLMDARRRGTAYDQSHLPVTEQYEAVGHAVRAVYLYTAMSEMATITGDLGYQSAVRSLWDNVVNRKYYLTGGVGNGETSEGFGSEYSLRNSAYCEACSSCGEIYFQASMARGYQDARYADLFEQTLYNALLGSIDLEGGRFRYTNPLDERGQRTLWHVCPCCVGNIPRTLLQLPSWMYATGPDSLYVNLFVGSTVNLPNVAGTKLELVQETDYPWNGDVSISVNPSEAKEFAVYVRAPQRDVSTLYSATPAANGILSLAVNGQSLTPPIENGYVAIRRTWQAGDKITLALPMDIQRVKCDERVVANRGRVALRRGPLVYNIESVDGDVDRALSPSEPLKSEWREDLLNGVWVITGKFADGSPLVAVPNYARSNRGGQQNRTIVWLKEQQ